MTLVVPSGWSYIGSYKRFLSQKFEGFTHIYKSRFTPCVVTFCRYLGYNYSLLYAVLSYRQHYRLVIDRVLGTLDKLLDNLDIKNRTMGGI